MYKHFIKRYLSFFVALIALILIGWLIVIFAILLYFTNKGAGAFFCQLRPGKNEKIFKLIKFRTMNDECDENDKLLPDKQRLTKIGRFVRITSIDELPQLINVLKGEMSFIGPRPLYVRYLPYYSEEEHLRHTVRPGITGLAQTNGRKSITWSQKLHYDVDYVNNLSFKMDCKIFCRTVKAVLTREDVGVENSGTNDFNDFREREWLTKGRQYLIDKARKEVETLKLSI